MSPTVRLLIGVYCITLWILIGYIAYCDAFKTGEDELNFGQYFVMVFGSPVIVPLVLVVMVFEEIYKAIRRKRKRKIKLRERNKSLLRSCTQEKRSVDSI